MSEENHQNSVTVCKVSLRVSDMFLNCMPRCFCTVASTVHPSTKIWVPFFNQIIVEPRLLKFNFDFPSLLNPQSSSHPVSRHWSLPRVCVSAKTFVALIFLYDPLLHWMHVFVTICFAFQTQSQLLDLSCIQSWAQMAVQRKSLDQILDEKTQVPSLRQYFLKFKSWFSTFWIFKFWLLEITPFRGCCANTHSYWRTGISGTLCFSKVNEIQPSYIETFPSTKIVL